jgi:hypothetical protein
MDDANRCSSDRGLMTMCGMRYYVAVLHDSMYRWNSLAIKHNCTCFYCVFLGGNWYQSDVPILYLLIYLKICYSTGTSCTTYKSPLRTYVVFHRSVSKLVLEYFQDLPVSPALFAKCIVCVMIRCHSSEAILVKVRPWPRVARCDYYWWWWKKFIWRTRLWSRHLVINNSEGELSTGDAPTSEQILENFGRRSQKCDRVLLSLLLIARIIILKPIHTELLPSDDMDSDRN